MAEEIKIRLVVDSSGSSNTIKQLEATVLSLQKKLAEVKQTSNPIIPKEAIAPAVGSINELKTKLTDLKKQLGAAEIGTDGFKQLSIQIKATEDQLKNAATAVKGIDAAPAAGSIQDLRNKVKEMTAEINQVQIGSARFRELEFSIGKANAELRETKQDLKGLTPEQMVSSFLKIGQGAIAGFGAASSAISLFKGESASAEAVQRAQAKAQEYLTLVTSAGVIAEGIDEAIKKRKLVTTTLLTIATRAQIAVQAALNAVMSANPIALVVLAVAGLVAGMIALKDKFAIVGKAAEIAFAPIKFLIDGFQKLGNAMGLIGDEQTKKLGKSIAEQRQLVLDKYTQEIALAKAAGKETDQLEIRKLQAAKSFAEFDLARLAKKNSLTDEEIAKQKELEKTVIDSNNEIAVIKVAADKRAADESAKNNKVEVKEVKDAAAEKKALYDKELAELEDRNRVAILKTQEGSAERMRAEIEAITSERDFALKNTTLTETQRQIIILESENKITAIRKGAADKAKEIADKAVADMAAAAKVAEDSAFSAKQDNANREISILRKAASDRNATLADRVVALKKILDQEIVLEDSKRVKDLKANDDALAKGEITLEAHEAKRKKIFQDSADAIANITAKSAEDQKSVYELLIKNITDLAREGITIVNSLKEVESIGVDALSEREAERLKNKEKNNEAEKKSLKAKLDAGIISQTVYDKKIKALDENLAKDKTASEEKVEKEKKEIQKRYAAFELALGLAQIAANTAISITSATTTGPLGFLVIPTLVASGIAQAAVLIAQKAKVLSLATGGMVPGKGGPKDDDVPAMLSAGESVINARSTAMFAPLLSAINVAGGGVAFSNSNAPRFADGVINVPASTTSTASFERLEAIVAELAESVRISDSKPVTVLESDVTGTQKRVEVIKNRARIG